MSVAWVALVLAVFAVVCLLAIIVFGFVLVAKVKPMLGMFGGYVPKK